MGTATAQTVTPRITQQMDDTSRVALQGNVPMVLRSATDLGAADSSTTFEHVHLALQRSADQEAELQQYLAELQQKTSSNYHKWLTPEEFGKRFGPADSDLETVVGWLESQGFTNVSVAKSRTDVEFSGTAAQVERAFRTTLHSFKRNGRQFYANTSNPTIPSALAPVVSGVTHLSTFGPHPLSHPARLGQFDTETRRLKAMSSSVNPNYTYTSSGDSYLFLTPGDAATIYNTPNSFNAKFSSGTSYTGTGVSIGIIGDAAISTTPITNYRSKFLGESNPTAPTVTGSTNSTSDADEAYLDLEISGGMAPGATIRYYTGSDGSLETQISTALNANLIDILSVSFGSCEQDMTSSDNALISRYWQQAAAQGIAVTVSAGDSGSAGCDYTSDSNGNNVTTATGGLAVNGLGSTLYNIAVGGTDFQLTQSNFSTYVGTSNSSSSYYRTALSYIPEKTWNDSTQTNTTISANVPWTTSSTTITPNIVAAAGGKSSCSTNSTTSTTAGTCTSGWSKPSWQRGTGVSSDGVRDLPDVSLMSGVDYYSAWLVCTNDTSNGTTTNCGSSSSSSSFAFYGFGGTSAAAPAFAGILALVQQSQGGGRLGQAAANLYNIYNNSSSASSIFHDITTGNIAVPCTSGSTNCTKNSAGYYFESGYDTNTGYDLASGLGSVDTTALINNWSSGMGTATATVAVTPASSTVNIGNALSVAVAVSGSGSTPGGSVTLTSGSYTSSPVSLDDGSATIRIPANSLTSGTATLTVTYSGDGTYSSAVGTATVTVDGTALTTTTTTLSSSSTSPTYGSSITLTAAVSASAATGTVVFYDGSATLGTGTLSSGTATLATSSLAIGTHTLTASYGGDSSYAGSTSSSISVTVSSASSSSGTGSFTLSATNVTAKSGSSGISTVTVTPSSGYTGTVGFTLSTSSTSLQNYGCYEVEGATVSSTSAVTTSLTIYTSESECTSAAAVRKNAVHNFSGKLQTISTNHRPSSSPMHGSLPYGVASLSGVLLLGLRRRGKWMATLGVLLLMTGLGFTIGCGGSSTSSTSSSTSSSSSNSVPTGTYSLTLTGTDSSSSSISNTTTFTLTVN